MNVFGYEVSTDEGAWKTGIAIAGAIGAVLVPFWSKAAAARRKARAEEAAADQLDQTLTEVPKLRARIELLKDEAAGLRSVAARYEAENEALRRYGTALPTDVLAKIGETHATLARHDDASRMLRERMETLVSGIGEQIRETQSMQAEALAKVAEIAATLRQATDALTAMREWIPGQFGRYHDRFDGLVKTVEAIHREVRDTECVQEARRRRLEDSEGDQS